MEFYEDLPPWRKEVYDRRVQKILDTHKNTSEFPASFWRRLGFSTEMRAINTIWQATSYYDKVLVENPLTRFIRVMMGKPEFPGPTTPSAVKELAGAALVDAAALGQTNTCEMLLGPGFEANVNTKNRYGHSAFSYAFARKRLGTASFLISHGAQIRSASKYAWHPVLKASHDGWIPALNMFKYHKMDFNKGYAVWEREKSKFARPQKYIMYPLEAAFLGKQSRAVRFLLDNGADVNVFNPSTGFYTIRALAKDSDSSAFLDVETKEILMKKIQESPVASAPQQPRTLMQRVRSSFLR